MQAPIHTGGRDPNNHKNGQKDGGGLGVQRLVSADGASSYPVATCGGEVVETDTTKDGPGGCGSTLTVQKPLGLDQVVVRIAGGTLVFCGLWTFMGWFAQKAWWWQLLQHLGTMKATTSLGFVCTGGAMCLQTVRGRTAVLFRRLAAVALTGAALFAMLTLLEYAAETDLCINQWLVPKSGTHAVPTPGRMSFNGAVCLLLAVCAVAMENRRGTDRAGSARNAVSAWLGACLIAVALAALAAHIQRGSVGSDWLNMAGMSVQVAVLYVYQGGVFVWLAAKRTAFRWALGRALTLEFFIGLGLLVGVAVLAHWGASILWAVAADIRRSGEFLAHVSELRARIDVLEAAAGGYVAGGASELRNFWMEDAARAPNGLRALRQQLEHIARSAPGPTGRLTGLEEAVERWAESERAAVAIRDARKSEQAQRQRFLPESVGYRERVRKELSDLDAAERQRLFYGEAYSRSTLERTFGLLPPCALLGMLVLSYGMVRLSIEMDSRERDIRQRRLAEAQIRDLNTSLESRVRERTEKLEQAVKELDAFSYSVSHDLRAPLRAIDGFSRMVIEDCAAQLSTEGRRRLEVVRAEAQRMSRLIDDLLAFSRLGRTPVHPEWIDMAALAQNVFEELVVLGPNHRTIDFKVQPLPGVTGAPAMIRQLWTNLISNALKFTRGREVSRIEVGCRPDENGNAVYYIQDNGVGFDMRHATNLFGVFQRLHSAAEFEGTGAGLALVQRIVSRHGGRVWAEAEPDKGATFFFTLPNASL